MANPTRAQTTKMFDPSHDVYRYTPRSLQPIFSPKTVAVIGATEKTGSVGRTVLWNLISSPFGGTVFPVNPKRENILGIKAYPSIKDIPDPVDLAVIVTPAPTVPKIITDCVERGVRGAIVISAGFKEIGPEGVRLEERILQEARRGQMRVVGPNCLGVMNPLTGLNATFATAAAQPGNVAFISQSGALCTAVLDWSFKEHVGFSAFVSIGSMLDVGWGDLIYHLGDDPHTNSIVIYMETIGDARAFMSAAREVALAKPIIIIKPGRTEGAARAAASHTGSLTGSDEVLEAAFRRCGVLRVANIGDIFSMAEVLSKQPRPRGPNLTILTNAGGPGVLATDALLTSGGKLAELSAETMDKLNELLPPQWSRNNPVDILGDASPERYARALEVTAKDENSDGLLVILTPQAMTDPTATAEALKEYAQSYDKPILASWSGGQDIAAGEAILNKAGIPTYMYPDSAAEAFTYMWKYTRNLQSIYETVDFSGSGESANLDRAAAAAIINGVRRAGRVLLTEAESKALLSTYNLPVTPTVVAASVDEALESAKQTGYPVALKLHSETVTHKTDVGGVQLNLHNAEDVRRAYDAIRKGITDKHGEGHFLGVTVQPMIKLEGYELIVGSSVDPQFGPVLLFGMGGQLVEVFKDSALALPPLNLTLARRLIEQTKIYEALKGVRGRAPVDLRALEQLLVNFSQLVVEQPWIKEVDINPLIASPEKILALDARVVLHNVDDESQLPKLAIRPYPNQYVAPWTMKNGREAIIRPIRAEDEMMMLGFHASLSDRTVYLRYLSPMMLSARTTHERLARITHNDYDREIALVAEIEENGERAIVGVARLSKLHGADEDARYAMLISDKYQGQGLGKEMTKRAIQIGRAENIRRIIALMSPDNEAMRRLCEDVGFASFEIVPDSNMLKAEMKL
ncbi:MAG: GNAT family N-acetyltransferase [Anaerolineae bacterium CFX3]|nr:GNAT family N-acetyltransferase [Anaerolineae bacterium]MBV6466576.1 Protein lysine acetyltransferase Pat [Anaerolineales bacterium]MCE7904462.1 GNAT family N-acetyltransferase [Anaerolineae bacterium CFX3]MDL1927249.1 bifunctional acetate--CoA ligase family protein/GNAT family N-acetyltransferase [Anaerolineae bacterium AMX1]MCC7511773.1 bifunctional acetate--CoA ligase family protein/GNAT family N-acetyltransferase [Anaerolineae bacterium]